MNISKSRTNLIKRIAGSEKEANKRLIKEQSAIEQADKSIINFLDIIIDYNQHLAKSNKVENKDIQKLIQQRNFYEKNCNGKLAIGRFVLRDLISSLVFSYSKYISVVHNNLGETSEIMDVVIKNKEAERRYRQKGGLATRARYSFQHKKAIEIYKNNPNIPPKKLKALFKENIPEMYDKDKTLRQWAKKLCETGKLY